MSYIDSWLLLRGNEVGRCEKYEVGKKEREGFWKERKWRSVAEDEMIFGGDEREMENVNRLESQVKL